MNRAGILVECINLSQLGICLTTALNEIEQKNILDVIVFNYRWERLPLVARFCMMQPFEAWGFDAPIMATNLKTAMLLLKCPLPTKKFFYVWDLEWLYQKSEQYKFYQSIYQNPDLELIARSESHANLITKCWKKPLFIMENFDHAKLTELFTNQ